ncbi:MAG: hypothetical protein ACLQM8_09265, partial [Limisphaerales bacterium]
MTPLASQTGPQGFSQAARPALSESVSGPEFMPQKPSFTLASNQARLSKSTGKRLRSGGGVDHNAGVC